MASCAAQQPHAGDHVPAVPDERGHSCSDEPRFPGPRRACANTEPWRTAR
ncbi:Oligopeptide transport system permease protein OppB [Caballeronia sordidicola]|uniref:Oligopeptide transport system permease protein OppB n=1 Tax=Caballeronia sordidicola TaxID=196367 RepID=A0A242N032_CABSO|nr:Oligopeptide transport system permease protein OppB [Caballeronia sordidicola]